MNHAPSEPRRPARGFWRSRYAIGLVAFGAIALFFLLSEHRAHALGALPYLLLAASPLLHLFMHRGHSHGHSRPDDGKGRSTDGARQQGAPKGRSRARRHH